MVAIKNQRFRWEMVFSSKVMIIRGARAKIVKITSHKKTAWLTNSTDLIRHCNLLIVDNQRLKKAKIFLRLNKIQYIFNLRWLQILVQVDMPKCYQNPFLNQDRALIA